MALEVKAKFDRRGVILEEEVDVPFPEIELNIHLTTKADESAVALLKRELPKFCAISKIIRQCGTVLHENWTITRP